MQRHGPSISLRLSRSADEWVRAEAERVGVSVAEIVRRELDRALDERRDREWVRHGVAGGQSGGVGRRE